MSSAIRPRRLVAITASLVFFLASAATAQGQVLVVAERDLSFGLVMPGVPVSVSPLDVMNSAQLRMEGRGQYQLSFQLPADLTSDTDAIPLVFGQGDGVMVVNGRGRRRFDPNRAISLRLTRNRNEAQINLGGRALPAPGQPAGRYTATIVLMIMQSGT